MQRLIVGLFLAAACAGLQAQTMDVRATIPFSFRAGEAIMPAGDYTVHHSSSNLFLHHEGGGPSVLLLTNAASRTTPAPDARLEFHRYGERYFLAKIWVQDSREGREIPQGRAEKELARQAGLPQSAGVVLQRQ